MATAIEVLLGETLPTSFNGVLIEPEKNPCGTLGFFGRKDLQFVASGRVTTVSSADTETIWALLRSGALVRAW